MGGGLSTLKGNSWQPLEVVAESGNKVGDSEEDDDAIEVPLGRPSVLSSVNRALFATSEQSMPSPYSSSLASTHVSTKIHDRRRCRCRLQNQQSPHTHCSLTLSRTGRLRCTMCGGLRLCSRPKTLLALADNHELLDDDWKRTTQKYAPWICD